MATKIIKILVADDTESTLEIIRRNLEIKKYQVYTVKNVIDAIKMVKSIDIDILITDYKMPKISGIELIRFVSENYNHIGIIMITGYASIEGAVEAIKEGAEKYLTKPFTDEELYDAIEYTLNKCKSRNVYKDSIDKSNTYFGITGSSKKMRAVYNLIEKAQSTTATVLITGESGTGKELVARAIHNYKNNLSSPFIAINCSAIPQALFESELFGYVKGAFTGAVESRAGYFQRANGGTIFLDEISEISIDMQAKLLRVIQEKEICMIGKNKPVKISIRIIAASNSDLRQLVEKKMFREDLYYRLNILNIDMPPLREREDDSIILAHYFIKKYASEYNKNIPQFTDKMLSTIRNHTWPGNVRELENLMQRIIIINDKIIIDVCDLPNYMKHSLPIEYKCDKTLQQIEIEHINTVLNQYNGNKSKAARILDIDRKTLLKKLNES